MLTEARYKTVVGDLVLCPAEHMTWTGLRDLRHEGKWTWSNGSAARFFHWTVEEPNNQERSEHCLHTNYQEDKMWNDVPCSENYHSVCAPAQAVLKDASISNPARSLGYADINETL